eukprot:scaffold7447_cov353-Pinguiococcus_pyrenoidosus.AAC.4
MFYQRPSASLKLTTAAAAALDLGTPRLNAYGPNGPPTNVMDTDEVRDGRTCWWGWPDPED